MNHRRQTDPAEDPLIGAREAGRILGLAEATIRRLAARGELPVVRPAGLRAIRFRETDIRREACEEANLREAFRRAGGCLRDAQVDLIDDDPASIDAALALRHAPWTPPRNPKD